MHNKDPANCELGMLQRNQSTVNLKTKGGKNMIYMITNRSLKSIILALIVAIVATAFGLAPAFADMGPAPDSITVYNGISTTAMNPADQISSTTLTGNALHSAGVVNSSTILVDNNANPTAVFQFFDDGSTTSAATNTWYLQAAEVPPIMTLTGTTTNQYFIFV
jgi:hypothetical protein